MKKRYIDPMKLKMAIAINNMSENPKSLEDIIDEEPDADVVEHVCGEWIKLNGDWKDVDTKKPITIHQCSRCGAYFQNAPHNFCSQCGADMRRHIKIEF